MRTAHDTRDRFTSLGGFGRLSGPAPTASNRRGHRAPRPQTQTPTARGYRGALRVLDRADDIALMRSGTAVLPSFRPAPTP